MKSWIKYANLFIFIATLALFFNYKNHIQISTDFLSLLPETQQKQNLLLYNNFRNSKELFVAVKGFDKEALQKIKAIENKITKHKAFSLKSTLQTNKQLSEYREKYRFFIEDFQKRQTDAEEISQKLQLSRERLLGADLFYTLDKHDPLELFKIEKTETADKFQTKNAHLIIENFGYVSIFSIDNSFDTLDEYQDIYYYLDETLKNYKNIRYFTPVFYFVENSQKIKDDVNVLIFASLVVLLLLYIGVLKNIKLLINTIMTLGTSMLASLMILAVFVDEISVFVMAFGMAVSTIAIDYMFHHYMHNHYSQKKGFNTSVFLGFATTIIVFVIFSFVDFVLISQLSIFAFVSLTLSYVHFAFLYPLIGFDKRHTSIKLPTFLNINHKLVSLVSIIVILILSSFISIDTNFKNLDYHNEKLINDEVFFKSNLGASDYVPVLLKAKSIDELIEKNRFLQTVLRDAVIPLCEIIDKETFLKKSKELQKTDFRYIRDEVLKQSAKIGFREDFFKEAYSEKLLHPTYDEMNMQRLNAMGFDIVSKENNYYTNIFIDKNDIALISEFDFVSVMDARKIFADSLLSLKNQLLLSALLIIAIIIGILYAACKKRFFVGASFVLMPSALILLIFSSGALSILHLFTMFVIISLSIDYGIYIARDEIFDHATKDAIIFSLLSTFAGFGVLVFSEIESLHIIGVVSSVGIGAILLLLLNKKSIE